MIGIDIAGEEGYPQGKNTTQVTGNVVHPVVPPVGKQEEGNRTVVPHEDVPHVGVIIGADGHLDLFTISEQKGSCQHDQGEGESQDPDGPSHHMIRNDLGWFVLLLIQAGTLHG